MLPVQLPEMTHVRQFADGITQNLQPNRSPRPRTSPCVRKLAMRAPFTAFSRAQSEKMIRGDLPPSSKVTGLIPLAAISMIWQKQGHKRQVTHGQYRGWRGEETPKGRATRGLHQQQKQPAHTKGKLGSLDLFNSDCRCSQREQPPCVPQCDGAFTLTPVGTLPVKEILATSGC